MKNLFFTSFLALSFFTISQTMEKKTIEDEDCNKLKRFLYLQDQNLKEDYPSSFGLKSEDLEFMRLFLQHPDNIEEDKLVSLIGNIRKKYFEIQIHYDLLTPPIHLDNNLDGFEKSYKETGYILLQYLGIYSAQYRISKEGFAQVLPTEIALRIASFYLGNSPL